MSWAIISWEAGAERRDVVGRYFGWANQTLASVALRTGAVFLARRGGRWWLAVVPAVFVTIVTTSHILVEDVGFGLN
jgi:carbon starvation protein CstA